MTRVSPTAGLRVLVADGTGPLGAGIVSRLSADGAAARDLAGAAVGVDAAHDLVAAAIEQLGGLDALVVGGGEAPESPLSATSDAQWDQVLESHLLAPWRLVCAARPALEASGGAVVVIASAAAEWPSARTGADSVASHALVAMARMLAVELEPVGVRVNAICPEPATSTREAPDVAAAVAVLLSPDAGDWTATTTVLDRGRRASLGAGTAVAT